MFDAIGLKIKSIAKVMCWVGIVTSAIIALVLTIVLASVSSWLSFFLWIIVLAIGFLVSWMGSTFIYGFGELIERVTSIDCQLAENKSSENNKAVQEQKPSVENDNDDRYQWAEVKIDAPIVKVVEKYVGADGCSYVRIRYNNGNVVSKKIAQDVYDKMWVGRSVAIEIAGDAIVSAVGRNA